MLSVFSNNAITYFAISKEDTWVMYDMVQIQKKEITNNNIEQSYFEVPDRDKFAALSRILDVEEDFYGIIFCNTKAETIEISNHLNEKGYSADSLHGDIQQNLREKVVKQFKQNKYGVLVATDVAARGMDVSDLTHVINYGLPQDPESYVHRIGRTGRAGKTGKAMSIIDPTERRKLAFIKSISKADIHKGKLPDAYEMVKIKRTRIKDHVETIIETEHFEEYLSFAKEILGEGDPSTTIAALIKHFVQDELNPKAYKEIKETTKESFSRSAKQNMRLFFAKGKDEGITPKYLLDMLKKDTGVDSRKINDIRILNNFSFFNTNGEDGDIILTVYKKMNNRKPLVAKARDRN
jgi:ATP-dependent RNA helicase DeaD